MAGSVLFKHRGIGLSFSFSFVAGVSGSGSAQSGGKKGSSARIADGVGYYECLSAANSANIRKIRRRSHSQNLECQMK